MTLGENKYVKFIVEDTGIGMNDREQERLKNLLNGRIKGSGKVSKDSVGLGLGLLISNEIAI